MTEHELFLALRKLYPKQEYALLPQVANATGSSANRHADALALSLWPSRGIHLHGFELKCDKRDWRRELENPEKAEPIATYCHYWSVVASSPKVVPVEEVPEGWGLVTWDSGKQRLVVTKKAPVRTDSKPPTWSFVAALLRQAQLTHAPDASLEAAKNEGIEIGKQYCATDIKYLQGQLDELRGEISAFEKASGIRIADNWRHSSADIGSALKRVLEGETGVSQQRSRLVNVARTILGALGEDGEVK